MASAAVIEDITTPTRGGRCLGLTEKSAQRKMSIGTDWTDIVFCVRYNLQGPLANFTGVPGGLTIGVCTSDGRFFGGGDGDVTLAVGSRVHWTGTVTYYAPNKVYSDSTNAYQFVKKASGTETPLINTTSVNAPDVIYDATSPTVNHLVMRFTKSSATQLYMLAMGQYGNPLYPTLEQVEDVLPSTDLVEIETTILHSSSYGTGLHVSTTQTLGADIALLDSVFVANFLPYPIDIHDVTIARWA